MNHEGQRTLTALVFASMALSAAAGAEAAAKPAIPAGPQEVARPGGKVPGVPPLALVKVADGFNDPTNVAVANDGSGRIFVVERVGRVRIVTKDGRVLPEPFLDLTTTNQLNTEVLAGFTEQGLWSIAFHPRFKENGHFFVHYSSLPFNGAAIVARYTVDPKSSNRVTAEQANKTVKVIMNVPQPYYNHYGGTIAFGPDGYLYIGRGDGGWEGDPLDAGQRLDVLWGKLLRIDVDVPDNEPYRVPSDNPFYAASQPRMMQLFGVSEADFARIRPEARPEIWAYGLRNPYMIHFDRKSGDLFIADVGQNHWEEINWQPARSKGGENYGWRHNMGTHCHPLTGPDDKCPTIGTLPVAEYPHAEPYPGAKKLTEGWGCAAQGLGVANYAGMEKVYMVGDWCSGRIWAIGWDGTTWQMQEVMQTSLQLTAGNLDESGRILAVNCYCYYLADKGPLVNPKGALWRLVPRDQVPEGAELAPLARPGRQQ